MYILLIEDEELLANNIKSYFDEFYEFNFNLKKTVKDGLEALKESNYDLVITDLNLNDSQDINWLNKIGEIKPQQKVIVISSYSKSNLKQISSKISLLGYYEKPFDICEIHKQLKNIELNIIYER